MYNMLYIQILKINRYTQKPGRQNNTVFKDLIKHILFNYTDFENKVIDPDFTNFDLTEIPKFNR